MKEKHIPKYLQLKQEILGWLHSGELKSNDQMPSEHEISNQFQMSRQTVRQTLGELEKEGWLYRIQGKGTFVSSPQVRERENHVPKTIGMITTYISDYIFPHIVRGAEAALKSRGYNLLLSSTDNNKEKEKESLQMLLSQPLKGLIIEPTKSAQGNRNLNDYLSLAFQQVPFVMINECYHELHCPVVKVDDEEGGFLATEHLILLGHTHIVGVFKTDDRQGVNRLKGFLKAHQKYRIPLKPNAIIQYTTEEQKDATYSFLSSIAAEKKEDRPSAIVCYNDQLAVRIMEEIRQAGLHVPQDLSLVGFDDSTLAVATEVKLTTLTHTKEEMGEQAVKLLLEMVEKKHKEQPADIIVKPELIIRESTRTI